MRLSRAGHGFSSMIPPATRARPDPFALPMAGEIGEGWPEYVHAPGRSTGHNDRGIGCDPAGCVVDDDLAGAFDSDNQDVDYIVAMRFDTFVPLQDDQVHIEILTVRRPREALSPRPGDEAGKIDWLRHFISRFRCYGSPPSLVLDRNPSAYYYYSSNSIIVDLKRHRSSA